MFKIWKHLNDRFMSYSNKKLCQDLWNTLYLERSKQKRAPEVTYFWAESIFSNRIGLSGSQATENASSLAWEKIFHSV